MERFKGTPGEWRISQAGMTIEVKDGDGWTPICELMDMHGNLYPYALPNAKLIKNSKKLLKLLIMARDRLIEVMEENYGWYDKDNGVIPLIEEAIKESTKI